MPHVKDVSLFRPISEDSQENPQSPLLNSIEWATRGDCLLRRGEWSGAIDLYTRAVQSASKQIKGPIWVRRGIAQKKIGFKEGAISDLERGVATDPFQPLGWRLLGLLHNQTGKQEKALEAFEHLESLANSPQMLASAQLGKGLVFEEIGRLESALEAYQWARSARENLTEAWIGAGRILRELKQADRSLNLLRQAERKAPDGKQMAALLFEQGQAFRRKGEVEKASEKFREALKKDPAATEVWVHLGHLHEVEQVEYQKAIRCYKQALSEDPMSGDAWWGKGRVLQKSGSPLSAISPLQAAISCLESTEEARVDLALSLMRCQKMCQALRHIDIAIESKPDLAKAWNARAQILSAMGRDQKAELASEKAGDMNPIYSGPDPWTHRLGGGRN